MGIRQTAREQLTHEATQHGWIVTVDQAHNNTVMFATGKADSPAVIVKFSSTGAVVSMLSTLGSGWNMGAVTTGKREALLNLIVSHPVKSNVVAGGFPGARTAGEAVYTVRRGYVGYNTATGRRTATDVRTVAIVRGLHQAQLKADQFARRVQELTGAHVNQFRGDPNELWLSRGPVNTRVWYYVTDGAV